MARRSSNFGIYPERISNVLGDKEFSQKCPHCQVAFKAEKGEVYFGKDVDGDWAVAGALCPSCDRLVIYFEQGEKTSLVGYGGPDLPAFKPSESRLIRPEYVLPEPIPKDVPPEIAKDYREAMMVLAISPNASAALSRRCLQNIIENRSALDIQNFKKDVLYKEITQLIDSKSIANENVNKMLHAVRQVGNTAAHPINSTNSGLIINVEPREAELTLTVVGQLLWWYYTELPKEQQILDDIQKKEQEKS
jgi:hypothetical protein